MEDVRRSVVDDRMFGNPTPPIAGLENRIAGWCSCGHHQTKPDIRRRFAVPRGE
jgi:hypothetical protein